MEQQMNSNPLYELRVLSGEQRGAASSVRAGDTLRLGQDWANDVVLQQAGRSVATLFFREDGALLLKADDAGCSVGEEALPEGGESTVQLYKPFSVGDVQLAIGCVGAPQWASLFAENNAAHPASMAVSAGKEAEAAEVETRSDISPSFMEHLRSRGGWVKRLAAGGAGLVGISACALTLAWAMGPASLSPSERTGYLRQTLAHLGFGALDVDYRNGQLVIVGHLGTQAQKVKLEQALEGQNPVPRLAVWIDEQVAASVADVYRLNGISADVKPGAPGVVHVHTKEGNLEKLKQVQARARRDVPGLNQIVSDNDAPVVAARPEATTADPGKRIAAIVPGDPAYVVTADGTRYFEGAMLPTGHRILAIMADRVQIERDGSSSTLNF